MFTRTREVMEARHALVRAQVKPVVGTTIRGIQRKLPVRIHCQQARGKQNEVFAYATVIPLDATLTADGQKWYLRDFASTDQGGTKAVLTQKSRDRLLKHYDLHPVFGECDILPVIALKVVKVAASNRSVEVDIIEMPSEAVTQVCADLADIMMDSSLTPEQRKDAQDAFYAYFEIDHETRTAPEGPAA